MKKVFAIFLILILLTPAVFASDMPIRDNEHVLTAETILAHQLQALSDQYDVHIFVVTTESFGNQTAKSYADTCWRDTGAEDGILLLFSMTRRQWYIYTAGSCMDVFDDYALDQMEEAIVSALKAGDPDGAVEAFAETAQMAFEDYAAEQASLLWKTPLICLGIGAVIALIVVLVMASQHKSVRSQNQAGDYVRPGSFHLTQSLDLYLYHTTTRRPKPQNSGSGGSSKGGNHGGRGGSF